MGHGFPRGDARQPLQRVEWISRRTAADLLPGTRSRLKRSLETATGSAGLHRVAGQEISQPRLLTQFGPGLLDQSLG